MGGVDGYRWLVLHLPVDVAKVVYILGCELGCGSGCRCVIEFGCWSVGELHDVYSLVSGGCWAVASVAGWGGKRKVMVGV